MSRERRLRVAAKEPDAYSAEQWAALLAYDRAQSALERHLGRYNCLNLSDRGAHSTD